MNITLGTDTEYFVLRNESVVSAKKFTNGTKAEPEDVGDGYTAQLDNVMLEMGCEPAHSPEEFADTIQGMIKKAKEIVGTNYRLSERNSGWIGANLRNSEEAQQFGCDPAENAYYENAPYIMDAENGQRYAGGHIHIGHSPAVDRQLLVKLLDLCIELPLLESKKAHYSFPKFEGYGGGTRKDYYAVGGYRIKDYGTEYRTPCNLWTYLTRENLVILSTNIINAVEYLQYGEEDEFWEWYAEISEFELNLLKKNAVIMTDRTMFYNKMIPIMKREFDFREFK